MGYDWKHEGDVELKAGVTYTMIAQAFDECFFGDQTDEPQLPLTVEEDGTFDTDQCGWFEVQKGTLRYYFDGSSSSEDNSIQEFLTRVEQEYAAKGWIDYELDGEEGHTYGATELMKAKADLSMAETRLKSAQADVERHTKRVEALS